MNNGLFITVEGAEGVGKSTNIAFIRSTLESMGIEVVVTREPGGTEMAEEIREVLLKNRTEMVAESAELLLMFAARAQHIESLIKPALVAGKWVISDRFTDATYAYQGGGRGVAFEKIGILETFVQDDFRPDKTILLDAPVEIGMARAHKRGELDRFENEKSAFFERVRNVYLDRMKKDPQRFELIDASKDLETVQLQLKRVIEGIVEVSS
ncbi:dTMP kinase [Alkalimarinus sediminis]|uniref:Thymidylate kinase n=1 Tax=Alkalimarinus sediminis TaxID=1632866 RepID=A0A9E8KR11_9ALTE|nr:dTMP kinase [Alkalimarinus sediminis]UZW76474.1 dTMP kinase [Alkalimarinus sediminis]